MACKLIKRIKLFRSKFDGGITVLAPADMSVPDIFRITANARGVGFSRFDNTEYPNAWHQESYDSVYEIFSTSLLEEVSGELWLANN